MKYILTLKDPDHAMQDESGEDIRTLPPTAAAIKRRFVEYDEYVTIELDTETKTARVIPVGER